MSEQVLRPETPEQVGDVLAWAAAEAAALTVVGGGSKAAVGRPTPVERHLEMAALSGILAYEPEELVVTARAGTPMAELEAALAERGQQLAFEPGDWSRLLAPDGGAVANAGGTLGGVVACNLSGPRRIRDGAARDHLLGFHAVSGRGEEFKSGGTVVKNVTGFDLSKLITGSFGTLAVMTEVSVRALPTPEETLTVLLLGCEEECGMHAMTAALHAPYEVSGAAHLPADVATLSGVPGVHDAGGSVTAIRLEGPPPSNAYRAGKLREALGTYGSLGELDDGASRALWREIRDVAYFRDTPERQVWRLSVPPSEGPRVVADLLFDLHGQAFYDWGGGLVWLATDALADAGHELVRASICATGGHATLIRADAAVRAAVPVFQPQPAPLAALTRRVKEGFDPHGILNPGRMYEGV